MVEGSRWLEGRTGTWWQLSSKLRQLGLSPNYIVDVSVASDLRDSSRRVISLDQPSLGLAREQLMQGREHPTIRAAAKYMIDIARMLGADQRTVREEVDKVMDFHIKLASITQTREERRDTSLLYNPMTISEISRLNPDTPWLEYINKILTPDINQVTEDEIIIVDVPSFMRSMSALLAATPARVQANYLMWRVAGSTMSYMTEDAEKIGLKFAKKLTGRSAKPPRWKKCVGAATGSLSSAVGSLYVKKYFDENSKATALDMVNGIRDQFNIILEEVDWMDDATKVKAKDKANAMVEHIGYPPELLDMKKLTDLYDGLELSSDDFFGNGLNMTVFGTNYAFSKLREKVNKTDWVRHGNPAIVNAFYSPLENSIQFPAGILQGVFFGSGRPKYLNYGAIG